jgi:Flp pilus assembly pilin Flp
MLTTLTDNAVKDDGQTSIEYALVILLTVIVLATALGEGLTGVLDPAIETILGALS